MVLINILLNLKKDFQILTDSAKNLNDYLLNRKIDILFDYLPNSNYSEKSDLEIVSVFSFKTCFACSQDFYEKHKNEINSLKDLSKFELVVSGSSRRRNMLDEILLKNNVILKIDTMADYIKCNNSIGYFIEDELESYDLVKIDLEEEMPVNPVGIIYPKYVNQVTREFIKSVIELKK